MKKTSTTKEVENKTKMYMVKDAHDRIFTEAINGFDLVLEAGKAKEVNSIIAALIKKNYPYIEVL